ncbi:hypothetical protein FF38_01772 [Lucilia cuprina]|uniref:Ionotropic glutamate receptor C-terminal domain-containing protein n=1 Tax=Lucilia cuprina TaxID=7375 RepID=A0A0L0CN18_LUCCU|nr:hypothetical protein FF38_01772 [Lucilia cuprina]
MLPRSFIYYNANGSIKIDGYVENRTLEGKLDVATGVRPVYDDLINLAYPAYLQSYFTEPPSKQLVLTYDDISQAGMNIKASTRELKYLDPSIVNKYKDIFIFYENYDLYVEQRDTMDTNYAYTVTRPLWSVYDEKQKLFERRLYYYSSQLCLKELFFVVMPVRPGWPYRDLFNRHIMQLRDVGLMEHWTSNTFLTMLKFGHTNFEDLSTADKEKQEITLNDLFWIWDSIGEIGEPTILLTTLKQQHLRQLQHSNKFILLTCSWQYLNHLNISNTVYQYVPHIIWYQTTTDLQGNKEEITLDGNEHYFNCNIVKDIQTVSETLFANPFLNMQGLPIVTETDQLPPRSILFYDDFGKLQITGFIANYLTTFAERYNATLVIVPPANMGVAVYSDILGNKTFQGLLDIAAVVTRLSMHSSSSETFSYPVELMEYCYMIPLPHLRPAYHVFLDIIELNAMLIILCYSFIYAILLHIGQYNSFKNLNVIDIVLSDKIIRGLLGQSFVMPRQTSLFMKYLCFLLCYSSILICTTYQAYLQSHMVHPSLEKRMETYDDIRKNDYKILIHYRETVFLCPEILKRHNDLFIKVTDLERLLTLRQNMDIRYIYPVSQTRWFVFNERQKLFQRKLFYYSSQLCLSHLDLLSFPLRPGLPYRYQFNQHLLDVRDTGLLDHWLENNFLTMVSMKLSSFEDPTYEIFLREENDIIFANNFINMTNRIIITQSNLLPPFNILYKDEFEQNKLEGYVGNCVKTYAERHLAGLDIINTKNVLHYKELYDYVIQGIIDIPSIIIPLRHNGLSSNFSYPLEFIDECFMIPLPRAKPTKGIFFKIIQWNVLLIIVLLSMIYALFLNIEQFNTIHQIRLIDVIFSDKSIRGLLGQSFVMPQKMNGFIKYVYLLIFYTNIMIMTFYTAYLQSNLISPSREKKIRNLDDIREAGLKVAVHPRDLEDWDYNFYKNYQDILYITGDNYSDFKNLRDSMDLRYVYPVDYPSWTIYHEQQKLFQRKLFFFSNDLCISRMSLFAIPIRADLPYKEMFNQHLLEVRDTGLLQHWFDEIFIGFGYYIVDV